MPILHWKKKQNRMNNNQTKAPGSLFLSLPEIFLHRWILVLFGLRVGIFQ